MGLYDRPCHIGFAAMTETEARTLLREFDVLGGLESGIADQPWRKTEDGWSIPLDADGLSFHVQPVPQGLQVYATPPDDGPPIVWIVRRP
jgi:hypothetical protein